MKQPEIIIPRIVVRRRRPPRPQIGARVSAHYMRWELGRYRERLTAGPGGIGRRGIWIPERAAEQHNMVLDNAFELVPTAGFSKLNMYAAVGTGSTAPSASDTTLEAETAASGGSPPSGENDTIAEDTSSYTYTIQRVREFSEADVGGKNLTEWGWRPSSSGTLMSRELFRDDNGNPVTLTLDADQKLRLIYSIAVQVAPAAESGQAQTFSLTNYGDFNGQWWVARFHARAPLQLADFLAAGEGSCYACGGVGAYWMGLIGSMQPGDARNPSKVDHQNTYGLAYEPYAAGSRKRTVSEITVGTDKWNHDLYGIVIGIHRSSGVVWSDMDGVYFDFADHFTKDNLHKLIFNQFDGISWGP